MNLIKQVLKTIEAVNMSDLVVYDMEKSSPFYDYVVVVTGNDRQASALAAYIKAEYAPELVRGVEGKNGGWLLIDMKDIIIHVFSKEQREFYGFDRRLSGLKQIEL